MNGTADIVIPGFCGLGLHLGLDGFRLVYVCIAIVMWTVSGIFSREYMAHYANRRRYYIFFWATFAATAGVFLSKDLYTTFIFFEIMSFTSYVWVAFDEREASLRAAQTYLAVAVIGGMVMLMGLFLLYDLLGTLEIERIGELAGEVLSGNVPSGEMMPGNVPAGEARPGQAAQLYAAGGLLLFGFGAKAGCFPLHIWLPKAHPEAPAPASALLSGILTKTGVFGIIVVSCGMFGSDMRWGQLIAALGLVTMFVGALLAVFSVNLKRVLACSSISQIGFILTGIGMSCLLRSVGEDNSLAVRGAFLHMVNHSLFKLVLFLCAGAVFMNLHQLDLNDVRGFGRKKPALCFCFLMGTLGISGIPLWSGYISKTLIHESIVEYTKAVGGAAVWRMAEWVFLFTGGMTVAYMLKLFAALFVEQNSSRQKEFDGKCRTYMRPASTAALVSAAAVIPVFGMAPHLVMDRIAEMGQAFFGGGEMEEVIHYFSAGNLKGGLISIAIGVIFYTVVIRGLLMERESSGQKRYVNRWPSWLDLENLLYRPVIQVLLPGIFGAVFGFIDRYLVSTAVQVFLAVSAVVCRCMDHGVDGLIRLARATTHSQRPEPERRWDSELLARAVGSVIDRVVIFLMCLSGRKRAGYRHASVVPGLVRRERAVKEAGGLVEESFSFGLMLSCIGLCVTVLYLIIVFFRG